MANPQDLEQDAVNFAMRAVTCDQEGKSSMAIFYYCEAAQALMSALQAGSQLPGIVEKAQEYTSRSEVLKQGETGICSSELNMKSAQELNIDRAKFLVQQAFEQDELHNKEEALELYTQAAELCLNLRQDVKDPKLLNNITKLAEQALDRAESLKSSANPSSGAHNHAPPVQQRPLPTHSTAAAVPAQQQSDKKYPTLGPLGLSLREGDTGSKSPSMPRKTGLPSGGGGGGDAYSKEELQVLRTTSIINGREYVPFMMVDVKERFAYPVPFTDRNGLLALSPKQRDNFGKWMRPDQFCENPQMIYAVSCLSIRQTIVSDCSFVASLAIAAQYERRFRQKLITSIIYPQNRNGDPQFNPCGKYMVKLNLNGVLRKVIIDDFLPMNKYGELLCSYSNNKNELWVSLLEKAYMKVMGGYDFPGSNSNIDLHALTGWIPERISISRGKDEGSVEKEFQKIFERFHKGHCLVTVATGEMSDAEADRAGLVPTHAYAMLDIQFIQGQKLFQLKNPWSHMRWKGNFSEKDTVHWTAGLKKALNFDPNAAAMIDNGVFWIDLESAKRFFDVIYVNWNPNIFSHTTCYHQTWTAKEGPKKDSYSIGDNPQYRLEIKPSNSAAVWVLLTRHITDKDDFANNREFITLLVYKTNGKRIYYPSEPPPYMDGVRINSPHYLCKMIASSGTNVYTLVISQYEKNNTIHYTLRVYATTEFKLTKVANPYVEKYEKRITGEWKGKTAGGCANYPETTIFNPTYQLKIDNKSTDNHVLVELRGPKTYSVGFEIVTISDNVPNSPGSFNKKTTGEFRRGFCYLELENIPGGIYNIRPSTFYPNQEAHFFLDFSSSVPITIAIVK